MPPKDEAHRSRLMRLVTARPTLYCCCNEKLIQTNSFRTRLYNRDHYLVRMQSNLATHGRPPLKNGHITPNNKTPNTQFFNEVYSPCPTGNFGSIEAVLSPIL